MQSDIREHEWLFVFIAIASTVIAWILLGGFIAPMIPQPILSFGGWFVWSLLRIGGVALIAAIMLNLVAGAKIMPTFYLIAFLHCLEYIVTHAVWELGYRIPAMGNPIITSAFMGMIAGAFIHPRPAFFES